MRVTLVNNFFPPRAGGSAHFTEAVAGELGARGHDVLVITSAHNAPAGWERRENFAIFRLPSWSPPPTRLAFGYDLTFCASPGNARRLHRLLDDFRPDVIHENNQIFDLSLMCSSWARRRNVPVVLTIHTALIHTQRLPALVLTAMDRSVSKSFIRMSRAHLVAPDVFMRDYIADRYDLHPPDRVTNIPIAVDLARFEKGSGEAARARLGIGNRPMILSLGHVIPLRDRLALVEAMPHILREIPDVAIVIAGHVYDDRFLRRAKELGVADNLILLGVVSKEEVHDLVAAADMGCHDLSGVGFGTASLEVMGSGTPTATFIREDNFPGLQLRNEENIIIVPIDAPAVFGAAIAKVLSDAGMRSRIGEQGRRLVMENFALPHVTEQYLGLYERLVKER